MKQYHIEQTYLSDNINDQVFWPAEWCRSFKHNLLPNWPFRIWVPAKLPKETSIFLESDIDLTVELIAVLKFSNFSFLLFTFIMTR